jgi:hypothetical protein
MLAAAARGEVETLKRLIASGAPLDPARTWHEKRRSCSR